VARHLLPLVASEHPNRRDIQLAIEVDAALSARAVRLALDLGRPPDSIASIDAVLDAVPLEVLAADLLSVQTIDRQALRDLGLARLWRHVLATGLAAQIIANRLGTIPPEQALLAGILHDIGQIALATALPRSYAQVLEQAQAAGTDLVEAERDILGADHAVLGKRLAARWGFSETLQNVIWLHHQAQVPTGDRGGLGVLTQVVHLADLVVRQHGFGFNPSEQVRASAPEAAERLGLSGGSAQQIGLQVASVFDLNSQPVGLEDEPAMEDMWTALAAANGRLGQLHRAEFAASSRLRAQARRTDLLMRLNARLASCRSARDVLSTVAATAREALGVGPIVPYLLGREGDYVEGVVCPADGGPEEHFLYPVTPGQGVDALLPAEPAGPPSAAAPARAERIEGWLFERQGARLGGGPFYTIPMLVEDRKVGGLVFALPGGRDLTPQETGELAALASMAGIALKRVQAEGDLVRLSEELAEVNRELQAAQEDRLQRRNVASMSEMAAGAAHEINNPLAIISGRAQQLAADENIAARKETLRTIIQQASRISDIIADLRLFARPPAPKFQTIDPAAIARQVAAEFEPKLADGSPQLRLEVPAQTAAIRVDPEQVAGAMKEVVQNALEACAGGRGANVTIAVEGSGPETAVRLVVADDGPGMDPQVRARAFDPFFCGHEAGRHRGLGLPKAYRAVEANGGQMALESAPGRGTTVRMTFRAAATA
jgi:signal transduction histidine kinase